MLKLSRACRDNLNVAVAFKAMGIESDQEIIQMVGPEPAFVALFMPTLQECKQLNIHTQQQALEYMGQSFSLSEVTITYSCLFLLPQILEKSAQHEIETANLPTCDLYSLTITASTQISY